MANTYSNSPVLSKIKIGTNYYYLKDNDVRTIIDGYNNDIVTGSIGKVSDNNNSFVTAENIKSYVDSAVAVGLVIEVVDELPEASAKEMGKIYLKSDTHGSGDNYDEYIVVRTGTEGSYEYNWEKIGNTDIDLSGYVSDVKFEDKSLKVQKGGRGEYSSIHTFGAMADANTAKGTLSTVDSASFNYTPSGTVNVTLKDSETTTSIKSTGSFKPTGSITGDAIKGGSIAVTLSDSTTGTAASVAYEDYTPGGTVTAPTITVDPTTANINVVGEKGTLPSFTAGTFTTNVPTKIDTTKFSGGSITTGSVTFPTLTAASVSTKPTAQFATKGLVATIGTSGTDVETLILSDATTSSAMTDVTIDGGSLNGGSYTAPVLTPASLAEGFYTEGSAALKTDDTFNAGALPTLVQMAVMTDVSASATAPTFTGNAAAIKVSGVTYNKQIIESATFTGDAATLEFAGDDGSVSVEGSYNKQVVSTATFTGYAATGSEVSLTKSDKTVTVNPDSK